MKLKLTYSALLPAALAFLLCAPMASCSTSDADIDSASGDVKTPLSISAVIQQGSEARTAGYDATAFEAGDEIGVFILSEDFSGGYTSVASYDYNVKATYDGSSWTLSQTVYLDDQTAQVIAYYPYSSSYGNKLPSSTSGIDFSITPSDNEQTDVLRSSAVSVSNGSPTAALTFSHALSRLTVNVILSGQIETAKLSAVSISGDNLPDSTKLGISGDAFTLIDVNNYTEAMTINCDTTLTTETARSVDFLISPYSPTTLDASFVIDGETYSIDLTNSSGWQSGYQYTYNITANRLEDILLEVTSSSVINAWGDKGTVSEIDIEYQDAEETTADNSSTVNGYEAVDLGLSVRWAVFNIGASSQEDYGSFYAWGEIEGKSSYTSSNCTTYSQEIEDFSGNAEYDVATALWGGTWRIPTETEMQELVDNCTWNYTSVNYVYGYEVTGTNGNSIFLPIGGYYNGSNYVSKGTHGAYWTSTPYGTSTTSAWNLAFNNSSYKTESAIRYHGHLVRAVTE